MKKVKKLQDEHGTLFKVFLRNTSIVIAKWIVNTPITPNQITWFRLFFQIPIMYLFYLGGHLHVIAGAFLWTVSHLLDYVDGSLARLRGTQSNYGFWIDKITDELERILLFFAIALGVARLNNDYFIFIFAFFASTAYLINGMMYMLFRQLFEGADDVMQEEKGKRKILKNLFYIEPFLNVTLIIFALLNMMELYLMFLGVYGFAFSWAMFFMLSKKSLKCKEKEKML